MHEYTLFNQKYTFPYFTLDKAAKGVLFSNLTIPNMPIWLQFFNFTRNTYNGTAPAADGDITEKENQRMENVALEVLEEGTEMSLEGPLACCMAALFDLL